MQVRIIGGSGGVTKTTSATSYLIDETLLIDAGSVASGLEIEEQAKIEHILISHAHLDHTKDLAFICDNCLGLKSAPFQVHTHQTTLKAIKDHLFNDVIWPDFSAIPSKEKAVITFHELSPGLRVELGGYSIEAIPVAHPGDAMGFIIEKAGVSLLFTQDTKATEEIWLAAKKRSNLKAIFTEVSFPNKLQNVADISDHHTPATMKREIEKMPEGVPIYLGHLKPNFREELLRQIGELNEDRITIMDGDGLVYRF